MIIMEMSKEMVQDLLKVQEEITNPTKTAKNPFFNSKYAPLPDILKEIRPILSMHGFVIIQDTGSIAGGDMIFVQTLLLHRSGGMYKTNPLYLNAKPLQREKKTTARNQQAQDKPQPIPPEGIDPQKAGSAITYGRRYQLSALLNISAEDDDDGNTAREIPPDTNKTTPKTENTKNKVKPRSGTKTPKRSLKNNRKELDIPRLQKIAHIDTAIETLQVGNKDLNLKNILTELEAMLGEQTITQDQFNNCKKELGLKV